MTHPPRVEHSPLPWKYDGVQFIFTSENDMIAEIRGFGANLPQDANAAFIVTACNAYSANQKALRVAVEALKKIGIGNNKERSTGMDTPPISVSRDHLRIWANDALERIREIQEGK